MDGELLQQQITRILKGDASEQQASLETLRQHIDDPAVLRSLIRLLPHFHVNHDVRNILLEEARLRKDYIVEALLQELQQTEDASLWREAATLLGTLHIERATPILQEGLRHKERAWGALHALKDLKNPTTLEALKEFVWNNPTDWSCVETALSIIRSFRRPEGFESLAEVMRGHSNHYVRAYAARLLRHVRLSQVIKALEETLYNDRELNVRREAATTLGYCRTPQADEVLLRALPTLQQAPAPPELLEYTTPIAWENARPVLLSAIADALARKAQPEATRVLREALQRETSARAIYAFVRALGKLKDREALPLIVPLLDHDDARVRREAALALHGIGDREVVPLLLRLLQEDKGKSVCTNAALALCQLGAVEAGPAIVRAIDEKRVDEDKVVAALCLLGLEAEQSVLFAEGLRRKPRTAANSVLKFLQSLLRNKRVPTEKQQKLILLCRHHPRVVSYKHFQNNFSRLIESFENAREV